MTKSYELLTVYKSNLDAEEIDKQVDKISDLISEAGGKVESVEKIGRKKLAYDIKNFRDGFFVNSTLTIPADKIVELKRQLKLNDSILRTMFLEVSKKACVS
ncbi:MAG: 30S ribosomal protein S6 [Heliobacteriaceae bacterium]|jgi:small subunit ribosomal protein S6|nr:30S ribosomal protein S6 [Heliobacteriaceae bacterium]